MRIKHIQAIAVSLPLIKPVKMSFEEVRNAENILARIETSDGIVGWGEAASAPTMTGETLGSMVAADPAFTDTLAKVQVVPDYRDTPDFKAFFDADYKRMARAVQKIGKL